jgi:hypothetical protein
MFMKKISLLLGFVLVFSLSPLEAGVSTDTIKTDGDTTPPIVKKRFWRATAEAYGIGWFIPWSFSHFIMDYDYADISMDTVRRNFEDGFWFDRDNFDVNQKGHPLQGSMYFNAARVNGYSFWESAPFVLVGDFGWEFLMEAEQPSYNDIVNTFFGGMSRGEISYRLSKSVLDNRAGGSNRFWREIGAGFLNPVGFADRLIFGDMWKKFDNPPDRFPSKLFITMDGGYSRGRRSSEHPDFGYLDLELRQNDPHVTPIKLPFDYYDMEGTLACGQGPILPYATLRGLLAGWEVKDEQGVRHMVSPGLTYIYFNNEASAFGGQGLDMMMLSRWDLPNDFQLRTEAGGQGIIFAGIQTDYTDESLSATGRNYDYGSGGGPKVDIRLRKDDVDWFRCTAWAGWYPTNNGISTENRIIVINTEARMPIRKDLYAGLGWGFQERFTLYDLLPQTTRTNSTIKFFLSWAFRII